MLFLDGVGIGKADPSINPFFRARLPTIRSLFQGELPSLRRRRLAGTNATLIPLDATLGVGGPPQSGTGQTALFTGINGAKVIGKHFGPHPYSTLKPILEERNIFRQLLNVGRRPCFANAFPQKFFDYVEQKRRPLSVTTLSCLMSGVRLRSVEDLALSNAVSADITNAGWPGLGHSGIEQIQPEEAGRRLVRLGREHDFVLFEYWKTDHAGHSRNIEEAVNALECFDTMLAGIIETIDVRETLLLITSDHGNIEDMSTKMHTRNAVPLILYGHAHAEFARAIQARRKKPTCDLTDITPTIMQVLAGD